MSWLWWKGGETVPVCPFAAAMCRRLLLLYGSSARVWIVVVGVERLLAVDSMLAMRSWVSPVRAR